MGINSFEPRTLLWNSVIVLMFLLLNYQSFSVLSLGEESGIKPYHLFFIAITPFIVRGFRLDVSEAFPVLIFFFVICLTSVLGGIADQEINILFLNYLFAFAAFLISYAIYDLTDDKVAFLNMLRIASFFIIVIVLINIFSARESILAYLKSPLHHPALTFFYAGGPNLEATWLVMNGAFFSKSKWFWPYWIISICIAVLYSSRVAFILGVVLPFLCFRQLRSYRSLLLMPLIGLALFGVILIVSPYILDRFMVIGSDPGSLGRLDLWRGAWGILQNLPIVGYGAGNSVNEIYELIGHVDDDNLHNYTAQVLLDFGFLGLLSWLVLIFYVIRHLYKDISFDYYGIYIVLFLVGSILQFRGAEALFWSVMGFYVASRNKYSMV